MTSEKVPDSHLNTTPDISSDMAGRNNNSKVIISIDDTALLHTPSEHIRAQSLNRLNSLDERGDSANMYRCPSFPHLLKHCGSQVSMHTNFSMTHLETGSMSPRISLDNLTISSKDELDARDRLSLGGQPGFVRSVSSRTVDELPPLGFPVTQFERLTHSYLSPNESFRDKLSPTVSRSTSCPSMAYARRSPSPRSTNNPEPSRAEVNRGLPVVTDMQTPSAYSDQCDVNLEGEVITGLTLSPERNFPEFLPESGKQPNPTNEHPAYTRQLLEKQRDRLNLIKQNGDMYRHHQSPATNNKDDDQQNPAGYVNIGDIPSVVAERVMDKTAPSSTHGRRAAFRVQKKCLQWLNSLDHDDGS